MTEPMHIEGLFPIPIGIHPLDNDITEDQLDFISSREKRPNNNNRLSVDWNVLDAKEMQSIKASCQIGLDKYFQEVFVPVNTCSLSITQSWFNYSSISDSHHEHIHPNSFISAVLYIAGDEGQDRIYFSIQNPWPFSIPQGEFNCWNSTSWWLPMRKNTLILFPSTLSHYVEPVHHDKERITMSFNTFPVGEIGHRDELTGVTIQRAS